MSKKKNATNKPATIELHDRVKIIDGALIKADKKSVHIQLEGSGGAAKKEISLVADTSFKKIVKKADGELVSEKDIHPKDLSEGDSLSVVALDPKKETDKIEALVVKVIKVTE